MSSLSLSSTGSCDLQTTSSIIIWQWWGREEQRRTGKERRGLGEGESKCLPSKDQYPNYSPGWPNGDYLSQLVWASVHCYDYGMLPFGLLPTFPQKTASVSVICYHLFKSDPQSLSCIFRQLQVPIISRAVLISVEGMHRNECHDGT